MWENKLFFFCSCSTLCCYHLINVVFFWHHTNYAYKIHWCFFGLGQKYISFRSVGSARRMCGSDPRVSRKQLTYRLECTRHVALPPDQRQLASARALGSFAKGSALCASSRRPTTKTAVGLGVCSNLYKHKKSVFSA